MKVANLELEPQPERDLFKMPQDFDFKVAFDKASRHAANYSVAFILDGDVFGSGTLVTVKGMYGILTADHVMRVLQKKGRKEFGLCVYGKHHRVEVSASQYHDFVVGDSRRQFDHVGPDLTFLMFTDKKIYSTLV